MKKYFLFFSIFFLLISFQTFGCGEGCAMKGKEILKTEEGKVSGTVLCAHCQLKQGDKCKTVLKTEDGKIFEICPDSLKDKKIDEHSQKKFEVVGKIVYPKEGNPFIHIKELKETK